MYEKKLRNDRNCRCRPRGSRRETFLMAQQTVTVQPSRKSLLALFFACSLLIVYLFGNALISKRIESS